MPSNILSSLLSKPSLSLVSSLTGIDTAATLKVKSVRIKYTSRVMRHMREDGTSIVDVRIIQPTGAELEIFCQTLDDLAIVNSVILDRSGVYTMKSRGLIVQNMMAEGEQIKQSADMISASPVRLTLSQLITQDAQLVTPQVAQPADSSVIDQGIQSLNTVVSGVQGLVANVQTTVQGLISQIATRMGSSA